MILRSSVDATKSAVIDYLALLHSSRLRLRRERAVIKGEGEAGESVVEDEEARGDETEGE